MLSLPFNEKSLRDPFASFNPAQLCGVLYEHNYFVAWGFLMRPACSIQLFF